MRYAELHAKTNFSFLEGASHPDELVARAAELGYAALAVTDCDSLAGVVRAHAAAKETGLKLILGAEVHPIDAPPVVLWTTDRASYGRLCRLLTVGRRRAAKGQCQLTLADVAEHAAGLVAGVVQGSGWVQGSGFGVQEDSSKFKVQSSKFADAVTTSTWNFEPGTSNLELRTLNSLRDIFPDRCYLLAELFRGPDDDGELARLGHLARQARLPLVAAGGVLYHSPARQPLFEVLAATRLGTTVAGLAEHRLANAERHLRPLETIAALYARYPQAIARTVEIADRCRFSLDELRYEYPEELVPPGLSPSDYLAQITWEGAQRRYPGGIPDKVRRLIEHELVLIRELHYEAYFLTVWDLVKFARGRGILCQGRGSAANSAVCYCLEVTSVDPERIDVLFERFVSRERNEAPDIDVDFEHERREEVLQYIYEKYGRERAGMTAVVITYRTRSAVRDVGQALGLSLDRVDALARQCEGRELDGYANPKADKHDQPADREEGENQRSAAASAPPLPLSPSPLPSPPLTPVSILARRCAEVGIDPSSPLGQRLVYLVAELIGFPRHLSQHVGGMVMTRGPLCELCPIENAAMPGRTVIQWDKNDLDELGILKVDCLSLGMLTAIRKCFELIEGSGFRVQGVPSSKFQVPSSTLKVPSSKCDTTADAANPTLNVERGTVNSLPLALPPRPSPLTLASIPPEDPRVYAMICRADTIGVFQIESRAQMSMLPRLKPQEFYDLVIEVAIVRPGPIQGNMVHPYLRRRNGEPVPPYPTPEIAAVLHKTLGVPLFQEQAMRLAVVAAGFTPGEADQLRRAMGAWRRTGVIDKFRQKLLDGMRARGLSDEFAQQVFHQIRGFGEYGFPESHAASFALLVYVSAWLKCYYPAAFTAALLNSQPMGFYAPAQLIRDAREHGVRVLPVDVNASGWDCGLEGTEGSGGRPEGSGFGAKGSGFQVPGSGQGSKFKVQGSKFETTDEAANPTLNIEPGTLNCSLRLGFRLLNGIPQAAVARIVAAREAGPFTSLDEFVRRTSLSAALVARLAEADVFGSLAADRRTALWQALGQEQRRREQPLFAGLTDEEPPAALPPMSPLEQVFADYRTSGLSLKAHPIGFFRRKLTAMKVVPCGRLAALPDGRRLNVAGLVLLRQRPGTAKGITFVTLEDETGVANLVIRPQVWERWYQIARTSPAWIAQGLLENKAGVIHLVVHRLEDFSARFQKLKARSRDFH